eukprot:GFUD01044805.1.p1 GENE.GFUD01044805.1~~GFUD01044805.1.p1  ORF type:complete len:765 (+),score=236.02 GFUD01044805.1:369-2663(+)
MSSRSTSQARQQPVCEAKNNQDVNTGSKPGKSSGGSFPRGSKRREPNSGSLSGPNPTRPGPKPRGGAGKRPPPRGSFPNYNPQDYEQMNQDDEFELGSVFNPGSKKQNYNHLLNFQFSARGPEQNNNRGHNNNRGPRGKARTYQTPFRKSYNKSHYLQANCQFIVKTAGDYSGHAVDPDTLVDWDLVEQVHLKTSGTDLTSCPICLFPPTAAKISRCGHVFCWPCILHYLALSDDSYRKCPICDQDIEKKDLKSVVAVPQENFSTGSTVQMKLMKRERNSLFAVPATDNFLDDFPAVNKPGINRSFVKMLRATSGQVRDNILARERRELEKQWGEEKDQPEACFIQEALTFLASREVEALTTLDNNVAPLQDVEQVDDLPEIQSLKITCRQKAVDPFDDGQENLDDLITLEDPAVKEASHQPRPRNMSGSSDASSEGDTEQRGETGVTAADLDISTVQQVNTETASGPQGPRQVFYFYQSSDGQPIFLHALNVQMLVKEFGCLEKCPETIQAEILEKETSMMTEDLRDRLRYLRHLPVASTFEVAELNIFDQVCKETLHHFKDQIEVRQRRRTRKLKDEKRRERKIQHEEDRMMGFPGSMVRVESDYYSSHSHTTNTTRTNSESDQSDLFPVWGGSQEDEGQAVDGGASQGGISFAKIAKAKPVVTQPATSLPRSSSFPTPTWTSLGSVQQMAARTRPTNRPDSDGEPEQEGYVPPPQPASLGDTLAAALQAADTGNNSGGGKKGKKGRGKQIMVSGGAPRPRL